MVYVLAATIWAQCMVSSKAHLGGNLVPSGAMRLVLDHATGANRSAHPARSESANLLQRNFKAAIEQDQRDAAFCLELLPRYDFNRGEGLN